MFLPEPLYKILPYLLAFFGGTAVAYSPNVLGMIAGAVLLGIGFMILRMRKQVLKARAQTAKNSRSYPRYD